MSAMQSLHAAALDLAAPLRAGGEAVYARVSSDSRDIRAGDLFVAIKGDRFDGHDFVAAALAQGAVGALVEAGHPRLTGLPTDAPLIEVSDTVAALGALAQAWRRKFSLPVVAITGSSGKTTVKDMVATVLRHAVGDAAVLATSGNLNNHLGVPLMLLRLRETHRYAVIEMGMNHFGEIAYLSRLALPDVAMINNAGTAHIGNLGSVAGIAQAKGEIFESLSNRGTAVINLDDDHADYWKSLNKSRRLLGFGLLRGDVQARELEVGPLASQFTLLTPGGEASVNLPTPGLHNVRNALATAAVCHALGLPVAAIAQGLGVFAGSKGRLQQKQARNGARVIDDSYNANPDSMHAAIDVLASLSGPRWLVLGDIGETDDIPARHAEIGTYARQQALPALLAMGDGMRHAVAAFGEGAEWFESHAALIAALQPRLTPDATVLVKGSRFMRMEHVVDALTATVQEGH